MQLRHAAIFPAVIVIVSIAAPESLAGKIFQIHEIEANGFVLPYNADSGWE